MQAIKDSMFDVLIAIDDGEFNEDNAPVMSDLKNYVQSLVLGQRGSLGRTKPGSWALVPNDDGMDSDARVDFIIEPTYIATATLTRYIIDYPSSCTFDEKYRKVLQDGMVFCTHRKLQGHGYESDDGAIKALTILSLGKIPLFLMRYPNFCPKLKRTIDDVANNMALRLENGTALGCWGNDYSSGFRSALETLYLLNDPETVESIETAGKDGLINKGDLSW